MPDGVWHWVLADAERFASQQVIQYHWRGGKGGILPGGYDANCIAAEAVLELLQGKPAKRRRPLAAEAEIPDTEVIAPPKRQKGLGQFAKSKIMANYFRLQITSNQLVMRVS